MSAVIEKMERKDHAELESISGSTTSTNLTIPENSESFDQYRNELLRSWLAENKLTKEIEGIYLTKQSKLVNILARTPEVAQTVYNKLVKDFLTILNRNGVNPEELCQAVYPPKVIEALYGFRIPFAKDAITDDTDATPVFTNGRMAGSCEVKIPYLRIADTKKLVYYIIQRLEKGITEDSLKENVPNLDELLPTLPAVPTDEATQRLIQSYEGLVRFQESIQAPGYGRVLVDDFEVFAKQIPTKIKSAELRDFIVNNLLRQTRNGVSINEAELGELLAKLYGERPRVQTAMPEVVMPEVYSIPAEIYAPKLPNAKSHTTLLIDVSGSMGGNDGRLYYLKKALIETVTLLAQKPGQTLTVITFQSIIQNILNGQALNKDTLPGIIAKIDDLQAGGCTDAQPALEQAFNAIEAGVNQKIILGTDGEFGLNKGSLTEILKRKGAMAPSIGVFAIDYSETGENVKNLEDIAGLGTEGSQLIFTKANEMDKTVKNLILDKANRVIDRITVTMEVEGAKQQSIVLTPCSANKVVQRIVDVPASLAEEAIRQNTALKLTFNVTYEDKSTATSQVMVSPLDLIAAQKRVTSARAKREYINEWYNHELYKLGIVQTNQLNLYTLEEQLKLLSDVQTAARAAKLPHDFIPDALMFVLAKWYKVKQAELEGYAYRNNPQAKYEKFKSNAEEAERYGFYALAFAFKNEMQTLEEKVWVDLRVAALVKIAYELNITSEVALDSHREMDAGMRDNIYRRILLEATTQGKPQEIIDRLKSKISNQWVKAALIEQSEIEYKEAFENLNINQQLSMITKVRSIAEKDPLATEQQRKELAQMWVNRMLVVNIAEITNNQNLLTKTPASNMASGATAGETTAEDLRHRFMRRKMRAAAAVAKPIQQEALMESAQALLKLTLEQQQEMLKKMKTAADSTGDKQVSEVIDDLNDDLGAAKEEGAKWEPFATEINVAVPKRVEQTFNTLDGGGIQNAASKPRYRRRVRRA